MKKLLLDTSVIIDFLRRKDKQNSLLFLLIKQERELAISIITYTELFSGRSVWEDKKLYDAIEKLCIGFIIYGLETNIAQKAGYLKAKSKIDLMDAIIAATALNFELNLVTLNTKDFEKIKDIKLFSSTYLTR